jgi:hypothetical protein
MQTQTYKNILPTTSDLMLFRVIDDTDGSTLLGGDVSGNNALFTQGLEALGIERLSYEKQIHKLSDLEIGESASIRLRQCGTKGTYRVLRVV